MMLNKAFGLVDWDKSINKVELYQPELHKKQLSRWMKQWNLPLETLDMMPSTGLIIQNVCAAFLYETNSSVCFIEGFISNKEASETDKEVCLDLVISSIIELAKNKGFKFVKGDSRYQAVVERAIKHEFRLSPHSYQAFFRRL